MRLTGWTDEVIDARSAFANDSLLEMEAVDVEAENRRAAKREKEVEKKAPKAGRGRR